MLTDKLLVFVSSAIKECAREREVARVAIESLNLEPVLFEDIGSRPHPPRQVYKQRLEASHLFVGVYRESYGWIAPDMMISGVEDELQLARSIGLDRLLYVLEEAPARDPRLADLIARAENSGVTIAWYRSADELHDRLRDDITAVVSERFVLPRGRDPLPLSAAESLDALVPNPTHRLPRLHVQQELERRLSSGYLVVVRGSIGSGKTVLTVMAASEKGWLYVDVRHLTFLESCKTIVAILSEISGTLGEPVATESGGAAAVLRQWSAIQSVTLVVDGMAEGGGLQDLLIDSLSAEKRLVLIPRAGSSLAVSRDLVVPPFDLKETAELVEAIRGTKPSPSETALLRARSGGNPLYLRYLASSEIGPVELSLRDLEVRAWKSLSPLGQELVAYLALTPHPVTPSDLQALLGLDNERVAQFSSILSESELLIRQSKNRVELVHDHLAETVGLEIESNAGVNAFYGMRLGEHLMANHEFAAAFIVLTRAGEQQKADSVLERAAREAARAGWGGRAILIYERKLELAQQQGDPSGQVESLLAMASAFQLAGLGSKSKEAIADAMKIAEQSNADEWILTVRYVQLELALQKTGGVEHLNEITLLRREYLAKGDAFNAARLSLILSAEYIANGQAHAALTAADEALEGFQSLGDRYGARLARFNKVSALSAIPDRENEAFELAKSLEQQVDPKRAPRERAIVCNIFARRSRMTGNPSEAIEYAREAIAIGEQLGDRRLVALNQINLGNSFRDLDRLDEALAEYRLSDRTSHEIGNVRMEASANELIASVHNQLGEYNLALVHSDHAISLIKNTTDRFTLARAFEERAVALAATSQSRRAVEAYKEAVVALSGFFEEDEFAAQLLFAGMAICAEERKPHRMIDLISGVVRLEEKASDTPVSEPDKINIEVVEAQLLALIKLFKPNAAVPLAALYFSCILRDVTPPIERVLFSRLTRTICRSATTPDLHKVAAVVGILSAVRWSCLRSEDVVFVSDTASDIITGLSYKPQMDGAAYWCVSIPLTRRIIATMQQLDDATNVTIATAGLALFLRLVEQAISGILGSEHIPRTEFEVHLVTEGEFERNVDPERKWLTKKVEQFIVTDSVDYSANDQPPIAIICADDFGTRWEPHHDPLSHIHLLLAATLERASSHLLGRRIDPKITHPKIKKLIQGFAIRPS